MLRLAPNEAWTLNNLGIIHYIRDEWSQARALFLRSFAMNPGCTTCKNIGTLFYLDGLYADAASFFRFHGYVSLGLAATQGDLGGQSGTTPQILLSGVSPRTQRNEGGFRNDAALFVGGEPFEGASAVMEFHFVGNAADPVITEAKLTWDPFHDKEKDYSLRLSAGRFWWPFGIHNAEWFSAVNAFSVLSPAATEVVPAHYTEVGGHGDPDLPDRDTILCEIW